jgi:hypothetical protein
MYDIFIILGLCVVVHYWKQWIVQKNELILRKLNFIQLKMFNDVACNLNSNLIKWDANGYKKYWKFAPNYGVEKIILKRHFSLLFI